jgi:hypothetical protein
MRGSAILYTVMSLLLVAVVFLFVRISTVNKTAASESERLNTSLLQLQDSLRGRSGHSIR